MNTRDAAGHLPAGMNSPSVADFHAVAAQASALGRPAIPALMLLARDGERPLARLCAITALGLMARHTPVAREALRRVARLPESGLHGYVIRAALEDYRWPYGGDWDPVARLDALGVDWWDPEFIPPRAARPGRRPAVSLEPPKPLPRDRFGDVIRDDDHPPVSPFEEGWWREQE
jgi:hypothetical protein